MLLYLLRRPCIFLLFAWRTAEALAAPTTPLIVTGGDNYPPYLFRGPEGQLQGFTVDAWRLWQQKTGVPVEFRPLPLADALKAVQTGQAQAIDNIFLTQDRQKLLTFGVPTMDVPSFVYARREVGNTNDPAQLNQLNIGVVKASSCAENLRAEGVTAVQIFPSNRDLIQTAREDRLQTFCMDGPPANYLLYKSGLREHFHPVHEMPTGQLHVAVRKGNEALLSEIRQGFERITPQEHEVLMGQWFSNSAVHRSRWERLLNPLLAALGLVGTAVLAWGMILKRMVNRRTAELNQQRQHLQTLISTVPDLVFVKDLTGRFLTCNPAYALRLGRTVDTVVGHQQDEWLRADQAQAELALDREVLSLSGRHVHEEQLIEPATGHARWFETVRTPLRNANDEVIGVLGIARDVTASRISEAQLRRVNQLYKVLTRVQESAHQTRDTRALLNAACLALVQEGGVRKAWTSAPDEDGALLRPVARAGTAPWPPARPLEAPTPMVASSDISSASRPEDEHAKEPADVQAWRTQSTVVCRLSEGSATVFQVATPLRIGARQRYVLCVEGEGMEPEEVALLERLAGQTSLAIAAIEAEGTRRIAVAALQDSEMRFSQMFQTSPVGMLLCRVADSQVVDVNTAWLEMFGMRLDDVLGEPLYQLPTWGGNEEFLATLRDALRQGRRVKGLELSLPRMHGEPLDLAFSATRMSIGAQDFQLASFGDITYQKLATRKLAAEAELLEREVARRTAELHSLFEALPDIYLRISPDGVLLDVRAGQTTEFPETPARLIGRHIEEVLPRHVVAGFLRGMADVQSSRQAATVEFELTVTSHVLQCFEARMVPAVDSADIVAVVRNVSAQRALQAEREAARERAELEAKHRSEFLANMSHEIRTPLNAILGFAQLGAATSLAPLPTASPNLSVAPSHESLSTPARQEGYHRILDAGRLLLGIINDVLDFSKIEAERLHVESIPCHPAHLILSAVDMVREVCRAKQLALTVDLSADLPTTCLSDPLRLQQILVNLLSNAVKFTSHGSIDVRAQISDDEIHIAVKDSGIGMSPEELVQIFAPFQQADASTTRRYGGTGLGLTISRRLAMLMGGEIRVESMPGQGSCFELRLPCIALKDAAAPSPVEPSSEGFRVALTTPMVDSVASTAQVAWTAQHQPLQGLHLLVAEDNEVNQLVIEQALRMAGAEVTLARNGREAVGLALAQDSPSFHAVLMDIQMPEMDGFEATRLILARKPGLPIIGQTAHALPAEQAACLAHGMVAHVAKPIEIPRLVATLAAVTHRPTGPVWSHSHAEH